MGVKQSKRSVDITEISTKGEIEGFGNEGKVEKILEGVPEKVSANGHVDGDLVNGGESQQNGIEPVQSREAAVASEKVLEMKDSNESAAGVVNGNVEDGELNGKTKKIDEEPKKTEDKKEKKKDKKEKVKKTFSFRNFSFSKKDKSKPSKEERSPETMVEAQAEDVTSSPIQEQCATEDETVTVIKPVDSATQINSSIEIEAKKTTEEPQRETEQISVESEKEMIPATVASSEDLPPPLPASPPPNEMVAAEQDSSLITVEKTPSSVNEVACTVTNILSEKIATTEEVIKNAEQIAVETGRQIEEKASNLLKTVEERACESMKTVGELISQKTEEIVEACQNAVVVPESAGQQGLQVDETAEKVAEDMTAAPVKVSNVESLSTNPEDSPEKREEGAGESLADIPQDLKDVAEAAIEPAETDSLEISAIPPPPPVVEPLTGE